MGMLGKITDYQMCEQVAAVLKTLAHAQRLSILCKLYRKEMTVGDLEAGCGISQPQVSQHLTRMRLEGIVESKRDGNHVYYSISDPQIRVLLESFQKVFKV